MSRKVPFLLVWLALCCSSPAPASPFDAPGHHIKMAARLGLMWTPYYPRSATADELSITRLAADGVPREMEFLHPDIERSLLTVKEQDGNQDSAFMLLKWNRDCIAVRATLAARQPGDYVVSDVGGGVRGPLDPAGLAAALAACGIGVDAPWLRPRDAHAFSVATFEDQPEMEYLRGQAREAAMIFGVILLAVFAVVGFVCCRIARARKVPPQRARLIGLAVWLIPTAIGTGLSYWMWL